MCTYLIYVGTYHVPYEGELQQLEPLFVGRRSKGQQGEHDPVIHRDVLLRIHE